MDKFFKTAQNLDQLLIHGRYAIKDDMLAIQWPASGIEIIFKGDRITFHFGQMTCDQALYLRLTVDGVSQKHSMTTGNEKIMTEDLPDGVHKLSLIRLNTDGAGVLLIDQIEIEGSDPALLPPPCAPAFKMEFYGDSITCGYGNLGYDGPGFLAHRSDAMKTYAYLLASQMCADGRFIGYSGQGMVHNWGGAVGTPFGRFYDRVLRDDPEKWDFSQWQADVVVINAGTNDDHGETTPEDFYDAARALMQGLREKYPQALIVWQLGLCGANRFFAPLEKLFGELSAHDKNAFFIPTKSIYSTPGELGGNGHPGLVAHRRAADELYAFIKEHI